MKKIREFLWNEKGTVLVVLAIAMSVLVGFTALVTDVGFIYLNEAKLANALDSAVLAGVQELPADPQLALEQAANYASLNGVLAGEASFQVDDSNRSISGTANVQLGLFFARALGFDSTNISAHSKAHIAPISSAVGIVPFGVNQGNYAFGQEVILKEGGGAGQNGYYGALRLGGNGADTYRDNIMYGHNGEIKIGDNIEVKPGNMSGPTSQGIAYRIEQCHHVPQCSIHSFMEGCPRIVIVPLGTTDEGHGANRNFMVSGFAAFLINEYVGHGNENEVYGSFIRYVIPGKTSDGAGDFGLYGAQLSE